MTTEQLKSICPNISDLNCRVYTELINDYIHEFNSVERLRCFIAQVAHESGEFKYTRELASGEAYEGRIDLGNTQKGDGVKFKGRGLIQVTGRDNYKRCSLYLFGDERLLEHPELLENPVEAMRSAIWFWQVNSLNQICDEEDYRHTWKGKPLTKFEWLTKRINGGLTGIKQRLEFYNRAKQVLK